MFSLFILKSENLSLLFLFLFSMIVVRETCSKLDVEERENGKNKGCERIISEVI